MITKNSNLAPSICKISFVPLEDVDSFTVGSTIFHYSISLKNGKSWTDIYFTPGSAEFSEKQKDTDAGELFEQSLKLLFPGDEDSNPSDLETAAGRPVVVKFTYSDNTSRFLGSSGNGARLAITTQVGQKSAGSQLEFTCMAEKTASWYS